jgi:hypothetical protein
MRLPHRQLPSFFPFSVQNYNVENFRSSSGNGNEAVLRLRLRLRNTAIHITNNVAIPHIYVESESSAAYAKLNWHSVSRIPYRNCLPFLRDDVRVSNVAPKWFCYVVYNLRLFNGLKKL